MKRNEKKTKTKRKLKELYHLCTPRRSCAPPVRKFSVSLTDISLLPFL